MPIDCQQALECWQRGCQGDSLCKPRPHQPRHPRPPQTPRGPCVGLCLPPGPGQGGPIFNVSLGCAPCEDGHIPSLPDCDCSAALPECCGATGFGALSCCTDQCTAHGGALIPCILGCGRNLPVYPPCPPAVHTEVTTTTTEVPPGAGQPPPPNAGCAPGQEPPCVGDQVFDSGTGCCSSPGVVVIPPISIPAGAAMLMIPPTAASDFLAYAARYSFTP